MLNESQKAEKRTKKDTSMTVNWEIPLFIPKCFLQTNLRKSGVDK